MGDRRKSVVIYGNCHTAIISQMLECCSEFNEKYFIIPTKQIQQIKDPKNLYEDCYNQCDVFIHQSIRLNNRYGEEYASQNIIDRLKPGCSVISIPNVYHLPLCFFPQYKETPELRRNGITYFIRDSIVDSHLDKPFRLKKLVKTDYEDSCLFSREDIKTSFDLFIDKVKKREKDWDIKVSDFILENYKSHQLFYDPNHPTNFFFNFLTTELLKLLQCTEITYLEHQSFGKCLDSMEMPVCKAVVEALQLNWGDSSVIRKSMPNTNLLQSKMDINSYAYQYMSCAWMVNDSKGFSHTFYLMSRLAWAINKSIFYISKIAKYFYRKR